MDSPENGAAEACYVDNIERAVIQGSGELGAPFAQPGRYSRLFEECLNNVRTRCNQFHRSSAGTRGWRSAKTPTQVGVFESGAFQTFATQAIKIPLDFRQTVGCARSVDGRNRLGRIRCADPVHVHFSIAVTPPAPMAFGNCPQKVFGGGRRGSRRPVRSKLDGVPTICV